jgi:drug/metabolite transporter (DMT)-like permease
MIGYALAACLGYGTADFLAGLAARKHSVVAALLIGQPIAFIGIGIAALLTPGHPNWPDSVLGFLAGTVGCVGLALLYKSLAQGAMAMASSLFGIMYATVPVMAGLLFGNRLTLLQSAGLLLALIAIYTLKRSPQAGLGQQSRATLLIPILAGCVLGAYHVLISQTSAASGLWPLAAARTPLLAGAIIFAIVRRPERLTSQWASLCALSTLAQVGATMLALLAVRGDQLAIAGILIALSPAVTTAFARWLLHEHLERDHIVGLMMSLMAIGLIVA